MKLRKRCFLLERTISDEEKIRRAIEISQRRNASYNMQKISRVNVNQKKDYHLFKRMILQILICLLIYFIFYLIETTNYTFSSDILSKTSKILNYDINFFEIYEKGLNNIKSIIGNLEANNNVEEEGKKEENEENGKVNLVENQVGSITQMERDAIFIKEKYQFIKPISGRISSEFGEREITSPVMSADHKGIDIAANKGTDIKAAIGGQVIAADKNNDYGNFIKIKQEDILTVYAHCEKLKVSKGDKVKKGDVIATVGSTGKSTGPHLHFEIRLDDRYINPRLVINF